MILGLLLPSLTYADGKLRVAVIDTGLDLDDYRFSSHLCEADSHKDFTGEGLLDRVGHGTHVTGIITENAKNSSKYCIIIIKYFSYNIDSTLLVDNMIQAIRWAGIQKADIVNISSTGFYYSEEERDAIKELPNTKFIVAAGNQGISIDRKKVYPAAYKLKNIYVVGALDKTGTKRFVDTNYGSVVKYWGIGEDVISTLPDHMCRFGNLVAHYNCYGGMSGTSMAAPAIAAYFINY